jgi:putative sporulation protein YyaC
MKNYISISYKDNEIISKLSDHLYKLIENIDKPYKDIIFVCIGTDRSTGDSLAPLIGHKLSKKYKVYGTIHNPVHAKNLEQILKEIDIENNLIIAIDACLGKMDHVGHVTIALGSLSPGEGVGKSLPEVGDISITGIVNFGGFMDFLTLQNTRLSTVITLAEIISKIIHITMRKISRETPMNRAFEIA